MDPARAALRSRVIGSPFEPPIVARQADVPRDGLDRREATAVGRAARLELWFEKRRDRTVLARGYAEPPFRIGRALEIDDAAYVIIVCAGPGVFPGDALRQSVHLGPGARVVLTSQAALQAHPGVAPAAAAIDHRYVLEDDAELHCHWDPIIPFAGSRVGQRFDVHMPSSARFYWSDGVIAGRVARGERWRFGDFAHELGVRVGGAVRYLERYRLVSWDDRSVTRTWMAGDADYLGTAVLYHDRATAETAASIQGELDRLKGNWRDDVRAAVDLVEPQLVVTRFMATGGVPFAAARAAFRRFALEHVFGSRHLAGRKSPFGG
jgi:urease accessory protein